LGESSRGKKLTELARQLSLPKSSLHCILLTLERRGYLERDERTHRYVFSLKLLSLVNLAISRVRVREAGFRCCNR
jgi:DNA-binding IclR family transcriptional regulator